MSREYSGEAGAAIICNSKPGALRVVGGSRGYNFFADDGELTIRSDACARKRSQRVCATHLPALLPEQEPCPASTRRGVRATPKGGLNH
jgi:hypothetical protein